MHKNIAAHKARNLRDAVRHYVERRIDSLTSYADILKKTLDAQAQNDQVMHSRGRQSVQLGLRTFRATVAPFRSEIGHKDPELAMEMAFYVFNASVLRKVQSYPSDTVFDHIDWRVMAEELTKVLLLYLKGDD
jgi:hypothetical protein